MVFEHTLPIVDGRERSSYIPPEDIAAGGEIGNENRLPAMEGGFFLAQNRGGSILENVQKTPPLELEVMV